MREGVVRGLAAGLVLGLVAVAAASVLMPPANPDRASAERPEPAPVERTYGPQPGGLPRLTSDTAPAAPPIPQGDE